MRTVPLYGAKAAGRVVRVDDDDFELVMRRRWNIYEYQRRPGRRPMGPYAVAQLSRGGTLRMHSLITGWPYVDHADNDGLNNQRYNLRKANQALNSANMRPHLGHRFKGVRLDKRDGRWYASITIDGKCYALGGHATEEDGARAYDVAALSAWGEFARLNFPD